MTPLVPLVAGLLCLGLGVGLLRSFGPRYRFARLLATTPLVSIADAIEIARSGPPRYVRIDGRVDSESEFEDAEHRPLVVRHTRMEARPGRRWRTFETAHEAVPFEIREGLDGIAIDHDAVADGLIVVRRESVGVVGDLGERAPADLPRDAPARAIVEHVSSVEHATVLGVPSVGPDGAPRLVAGLGRPLLLTTLERDEAMRVLSQGASRRVRLATAALAIGTVLLTVAVMLAAAGLVVPAIALGASPVPSGETGSDTRSSGQGPGLVGTPGIAILAVLAIGAAAVLLTLAYVRATGGSRDPG